MKVMFPSVDKVWSTHRHSFAAHTLHRCVSGPLNNPCLINKWFTGRPPSMHRCGGVHEIFNIRSNSLTWSNTSCRSFMTR
jgi:hypothetical protein